MSKQDRRISQLEAEVAELSAALEEEKERQAKLQRQSERDRNAARETEKRLAAELLVKGTELESKVAELSLEKADLETKTKEYEETARKLIAVQALVAGKDTAAIQETVLETKYKHALSSLQALARDHLCLPQHHFDAIVGQISREDLCHLHTAATNLAQPRGRDERMCSRDPPYLIPGFLALVKSFATAKGIIHGELKLLDLAKEQIGMGFDTRDNGIIRARIFEGRTLPLKIESAEGWESTSGLQSEYSTKTNKWGLEIAVSPKAIVPVAPVEVTAGFGSSQTVASATSTSWKRLIVRGAELSYSKGDDDLKKRIVSTMVSSKFDVEAYGTHVIVGVIYGGQLLVQTTDDSEETVTDRSGTVGVAGPLSVKASIGFARGTKDTSSRSTTRSTGNLRVEDSHSSLLPGSPLWPVSFHVRPLKDFFDGSNQEALQQAIHDLANIPINVTVFIQNVELGTWLDKNTDFTNYSAYCCIFKDKTKSDPFAIRHPKGMLKPSFSNNEVEWSPITHRDVPPLGNAFQWRIEGASGKNKAGFSIGAMHNGSMRYWWIQQKSGNLILSDTPHYFRFILYTPK